MLDRKEKRILLIIFLGVALVSLITSSVAAFVMPLVNFSTLKDAWMRNYGMVFTDYYVDFAGYATLGVAAFGAVFAVLFFLLKKNVRSYVCLGLAVAQIAYLVGMAWFLSVKLPGRGDGYTSFNYNNYPLFEAFLSSALSVVISSAIITVVSFILPKIPVQKGETEQEPAV